MFLASLALFTSWFDVTNVDGYKDETSQQTADTGLKYFLLTLENIDQKHAFMFYCLNLSY